MSDEIILVQGTEKLYIPRAYTHISVSYSGEMGDKGDTGAVGPPGALSGYETTALWTADLAVVDTQLDNLEAADGPWFNFNLTNGWGPYFGGHQVPRFRVIDNMVYFEGLAHRISDNFDIMTTFPVGLRPPNPVLFGVATNSGVGRVDINQNGEVIYRSGGSIWLSLTGIQYSRI